MNSDEETNEGKKIIKDVCEIVGNSGIAAIGPIIGGPQGAIFAAASSFLFGKYLEETRDDLSKRGRSRWEERRANLVIEYACKKYEEKKAAGETLRNDAFFKQQPIGHTACTEIPIVERPTSLEIIEGVILAAQREHEERKLPYHGYLIGNIPFNEGIDRSQMNLLTKLAERISFTQMCLLSIFSEPYKSKIKGRYFHSSAFPYEDMDLNSLFHEIFDLGSKGLLYCQNKPVTTAADLNNLELVKVAGVGPNLYRLMELGGIKEAHLDPIAFKLFPLESKKYPPQKRS